MTSTNYWRRMSPQDRIQLALNSLCRYNVEFVVEGNGTVNAAVLQQAVEAAAEANPGMRVRLRGRLGFCRWVDCGIAPRVMVVSDSRWDGRSERDGEFLGRFSPLEGGAVAEVVLLPGRPTRIVFRALHAAVDGGGLLHWTHDVFRALRGEPLQGARSSLNDYTFAKRQRRNVRHRPAKKTTCIAALPLQEPNPAENRLHYVWRRIDWNRAHSYMLFKMVRILGEYAHRFSTGSVRFVVPVDWRRWRQVPASTASMTGVIVVPYEPGDRIRDIAVRVRERLGRCADCYLSPSLRVVPWIPLAWLQTIVKGLVSAHYKPSKSIVTGSIVSLSVGRLSNLSCTGFTAEAAYGLPALVGRLNVVICSQPGKTVMTIAVPAPYQCNGQFDRLVAAIEASIDL